LNSVVCKRPLTFYVDNLTLSSRAPRSNGLHTLKFARIEVKISKSKQRKNHTYDST